MSKDEHRIRRIIFDLLNSEDIEEIVKMAQVEVARAVSCLEPRRFDRAVAIYRAGSEALGNASAGGRLARYTRAA